MIGLTNIDTIFSDHEHQKDIMLAKLQSATHCVRRPAPAGSHALFVATFHPSITRLTGSEIPPGGVLEPGAALFLPAGTASVMEFEDSTGIFAAVSQRLFYSAGLSVGGNRLLFPSFGTSRPQLHCLLTLLAFELENHANGETDLIHHLAGGLVAAIQESFTDLEPSHRHHKGGVAPRRLKDLLRYIEENLDKDLSLETLASLSACSVGHFVRAFKRSMGVSPHQFILQKRLTMAAKLAAVGSVTKGEAARLCGFGGASQLARAQRKALSEYTEPGLNDTSSPEPGARNDILDEPTMHHRRGVPRDRERHAARHPASAYRAEIGMAPQA